MKKQKNFTTLKEAIEDLKTLPSCNLADNSTDEYEARYVLTKMMINFQKCTYSAQARATHDEKKEYVDTIKNLTGLNEPSDLCEKFKIKGDMMTNLTRRRSFDFPIYVICQFLYSIENDYDFGYTLAKMNDGDWEYSWIAEWLANNGVDLSAQREDEREM